jgi:transposase
MKKGAPWLKTTWCNVPGRPAEPKAAIFRPNTTDSAPGAVPKKPSAPSPLPCSQPPTICSKNGTFYEDLGANHFDRREKGKHILRLVNRLQSLGYAVEITPRAA